MYTYYKCCVCIVYVVHTYECAPIHPQTHHKTYMNKYDVVFICILQIILQPLITYDSRGIRTYAALLFATTYVNNIVADRWHFYPF